MWFDQEPIDLSYPATAPHGFHHEAWFPVSADEIFRRLVETDEIRRWHKDFVGANWLTPPPPAVGSILDLGLVWIRARYRVLACEPGHRLALGAEALSHPILHALFEDFRIDPVPGGGTLLRWEIYYTPADSPADIQPVAERFYGHLFARSLDRLKEVVSEDVLEGRLVAEPTAHAAREGGGAGAPG